MPARARQILLIVAVALLAFVAGAWFDHDPRDPESPTAASASPTADPVSTEEPIEIPPESEP